MIWFNIVVYDTPAISAASEGDSFLFDSLMKHNIHKKSKKHKKSDIKICNKDNNYYITPIFKQVEGLQNLHKPQDLTVLGLFLYITPMNQLIITEGGIYDGGYYSSNDPDKAAVIIRTSEAVKISNSLIESMGDCISLEAKNAHVTIFNTEGVGQDPLKWGYQKGRFFNSNNNNDPEYIEIRNCRLDGTSGIRIRDTNNATIKVLNNYAYHIDGRFSDGEGGWINLLWDDSHLKYTQKTRQFIILRNCEDLTNTEIAWNRVDNVEIPGEFNENYAGTDGKALPMQEDVFNFNSSGRDNDEIKVHHNLVVGAFSFEPEKEEDYRGGGFIGDGDLCNHLHFYENTAVGCMNYTFSVATTGTVKFWNNTAVASGILPNGKLSGYNSCGLSHQLKKSPDSVFNMNQSAYMNTRQPQWDNGRGRNDWNFKNCENGNCEGNTHYIPENIAVERRDELMAIMQWEEVVKKNNQIIGIITDENPSNPCDELIEENERLKQENEALTKEITLIKSTWKMFNDLME